MSNKATGVDDVVRRRVHEQLVGVAAQHNVRILMAVESGSRAWNFASPDSDYDVRFIYCHPLDWYLTIDERSRRDVIELPVDANGLDISGWDLKKALRLFRKSNPSIIEWLQSPISYDCCAHNLGMTPRGGTHNLGMTPRGGTHNLRDTLREAVPWVYSPVAGWHHYVSMARSNGRDFLGTGHSADRPVRLKKYLYVTRALMAARWIERTWSPPPLPIDELVDNETKQVPVSEIQELVARKRELGELGTGQRIPALDDFILAELERAVDPALPGAMDNSVDWMDQIFKATLGDGCHCLQSSPRGWVPPE